MINKNWIKVIGLAATAIGFGATLLTDWVNDKKMTEEINVKISEALSKISGTTTD